MPTVVNRHRYLPRDGFGPEPAKPLTGRERRPALPDDAIYVGRGSPLGNPYRVPRDGTHAEALALYRRWLYEKIQSNDAKVMRAFRSIGPESLLVCSCAPKECHADVVLGAWTWLGKVGMR